MQNRNSVNNVKHIIQYIIQAAKDGKTYLTEQERTIKYTNVTIT